MRREEPPGNISTVIALLFSGLIFLAPAVWMIIVDLTTDSLGGVGLFFGGVMAIVGMLMIVPSIRMIIEIRKYNRAKVSRGDAGELLAKISLCKEADMFLDKILRRKPEPVGAYFEVGGPAQEFPPSHDGACSDDACPCPGDAIPWGDGYLYISDTVVNYRRKARSLAEGAALAQKLKSDWARQGLPGDIRAKLISTRGFKDVLIPILLCEQGAKLRRLDLVVAATDANHWWKTGLVPLRPTPRE